MCAYISGFKLFMLIAAMAALAFGIARLSVLYIKKKHGGFIDME